MSYRNVPKSVVKRLPIYLRILDNLVRRDIEIISSRNLSNESGFTAEQIRKDLAHFGAFGRRGTGYNTVFLREKILKIIGLDQKTNIVVFGAGHLGKALTRYNALKNPYVNIVAVFDKDPQTIGEKIEDIEVYDYGQAASIIRNNKIKVALIAVPAEAAQVVVDDILQYGITAILNLAPAKLHVPEHVRVHNVDLTIELQSLIYYSTAEDERMERLHRELAEEES